MDLLNRYLNAVAARLPEGQREEIAAEIREELLSRIEDGETRLHRPLTEPELSDSRRRATYLPQQDGIEESP